MIDNIVYTSEYQDKCKKELSDYLDKVILRWIPCSERLPDMATIQFESGHKKIDNYVPFIIPEGNWNESGFWDVGTSNAKVIAWMPCIKPYEIV